MLLVRSDIFGDAMKRLGIPFLLVVAVGCFAWAATTTDSEGGIVWTAVLLAVGIGCLALAIGVYRSPSR